MRRAEVLTTDTLAEPPKALIYLAMLLPQQARRGRWKEAHRSTIALIYMAPFLL